MVMHISQLNVAILDTVMSILDFVNAQKASRDTIVLEPLARIDAVVMAVA